MLNKLDDFLIHQTPEPIAHPATSDRNFYDRFWFNGYSRDGSYYFGIAMGLYPHRGVMDCAFSIVKRDGLQRCFFGSRRAPIDRTDMSVGPFRIDVFDAMRQLRVTLDDNASGLACDLTFSARTAPLEESRQTMMAGTRKFFDITRLNQFGRWSGEIRTPDGDIRVDPNECFGTKDRSWGVRNVGEPETGGAPQKPKGFFFLWAPLVWSDEITHAIFIESEKGEHITREAMVAPFYSSLEEVPEGKDPQEQIMETTSHSVSYIPNTRLVKTAEIDLVYENGNTRVIKLEPVLKFQMKGIGYLHPEWWHGTWKGELELGHDTFDPSEIDVLHTNNVHVQQLVSASDGSRTGIGALEHVCFGPYEPYGFTKWLDGAK
ncbi:MAG: hypothetical protein RJS97_00710 [Parvibaculaceae bacterium]